MSEGVEGCSLFSSDAVNVLANTDWVSMTADARLLQAEKMEFHINISAWIWIYDVFVCEREADVLSSVILSVWHVRDEIGYKPSPVMIDFHWNTALLHSYEQLTVQFNSITFICIELFTIHIISKRLYWKCMSPHYSLQWSVLRGNCLSYIFQKCTDTKSQLVKNLLIKQCNN